MYAVTDSIAMGGYAAYVWPALAVAALVMAALYVESRHALGAREAELEALHQTRGEAELEKTDGDEA